MPEIKLKENEAGNLVPDEDDDATSRYMLGRQVAHEYHSPATQLYIDHINQADLEAQAAESEERESRGISVSLERQEKEFAEGMVESMQRRRGEVKKELSAEDEEAETEMIQTALSAGLEAPNFDPTMAAGAGVGAVGMMSINAGKALLPSLGRAITAGVVNATGDLPIGVGMDVLDVKAPGLALPFGIAVGLLQGATIETAIEKGIIKAAKKAGQTLSKVDVADMVQTAKSNLSNQFGGVGPRRDVVIKKSTSIPWLYEKGEMPEIKGSGKNGQVLTDDVYKTLAERQKKYWDDQGVDITKMTPDNQERMSEMIAQEVEASYKSGGWGSKPTDKYMAVDDGTLHTAVANEWDELVTDRNANAAWKTALALTSNGQRPLNNYNDAVRAYKIFRETGNFPVEGASGIRGKVINKGFERYNELSEKWGPEILNKFLNTEFTVSELKAMGLEVGGEKTTSRVLGASVFGPKIGGAYLPNLMGNPDTLTMDLWVMNSHSRMMGEFNPGRQAPKNATQRDWLRGAFDGAQQKLARRGIKLDKNMVQAILWGHEQSVAKSLGAPIPMTETYAEAAIRKAKDKGLSDETLSRASDKRRAEIAKDEQGFWGQRAETLSETGRKKLVVGETARTIRSGLSDPANGTLASPYSRRGDRHSTKHSIGRYKNAEVVKYRLSQKTRNAMSAAGITTPDLLEITDPNKSNIFLSKIKAAQKSNQYGASVYLYSPEEYANMRLFITEDGMSGFALKGDDIVSGFSFPKKGGDKGGRATIPMLLHAIAEGGRRADSFDTILPQLYDEVGLKVVARVKWDDKYAPKGWDKKTFKHFNNGEPDVVYYAYDPNYYDRYKVGDGKLVKTAEEAEAIQAQSIANERAPGGAYPIRPASELPEGFMPAITNEINAEIAKTPFRRARDLLKSETGMVSAGNWQPAIKTYQDFVSANPGASVEDIVKATGLSKYEVETVQTLLRAQSSARAGAPEPPPRPETVGAGGSKSGIPTPPDMEKAADEFLQKSKNPDITGDYAPESNIRLWGADLQPKFMGEIESPEDIMRVISGTSETFAYQTEAARRGVRSWEETAEAAKQYNINDLLGRRLGTALNAEQIDNARTLLVSSSDTLKAMSEKVRLGQANDLEKMEFMKAFNLNYAIQMQLSGAAAEAGRALNIFKKVAQTDALRVGQIKDFLSQTGDAGLNPEKIAEAISGMDTPAQVAKLVKQAQRATTWDMFLEAWINGLLSGPVTHAVNATSNMLTALYMIPERLVAAGISNTPGIGSGAIRGGEASAQAFGLIEGFKDGLKSGWQSLKTGTSADATTKIEQAQYRAITAQNVKQLPAIKKIAPNALQEGGIAAYAVDALGEVIRGPGRFLTAEDDFFKAIGYRMELKASAFRKAASEGLDGDALAKRIQEIVENPQEMAPEIHVAAIDAARYQTYTNELGAGGRAIQTAANKIPGVKLIIPFIRTPANIVKFAMARTPMAPLMQSVRDDFIAGGARRDTAMARISLGSMAMATVAAFAAGGHITGGGPSDTGLRSNMYNQGWQPYSIKIGDTYYAYGRLEPLGMMMGLAADAVEIGGELSELENEEIAAVIVSAFSKNVMSKTWLRGLSEAVNALEDPDRYGPRYLQRFAGTAIPTGVAQIERVMSPEMSDVRSYLDAIISRTPGYSDDLPLRRNLWGEPITMSGALGPDIVSPIFTNKKRESKIDKELVRLKAPIRMPGRTQGFESDYGGSVRYNMDNVEYEKFIVTMNEVKLYSTDQTLKKSLDNLVTKDLNYRAADDETKETMIRGYINEAKKLAREELYNSDRQLKEIVDSETMLRQKAAANF